MRKNATDNVFTRVSRKMTFDGYVICAVSTVN